MMPAGHSRSTVSRFPVLQRARELAILLRDAGERWWDDNCLRLGASLAYYAVFSIFPLLLLALTGLGFFLGHDADTRARLLDTVASASSPAFRELFDDSLQSMQQHETARGIGAVVGLVTLVIGASAVFSELEATLNQIWHVQAKPTDVWRSVLGAIKDKAISFCVVVAAALALLLSLLLSAALSAVAAGAPGNLAHATLWIVAETGASIGVLTLILAAMFRMIPQTDVAWRDVFGGALLSALLFTGTKRLLAWYLAHLGNYAAYGAVGGFLGLLAWIYLASLFLFYGAEFTHTYATRYGSLAKARGTPATESSHGPESGEHAQSSAGASASGQCDRGNEADGHGGGRVVVTTGRGAPGYVRCDGRRSHPDRAMAAPRHG